MAQQQQQRAQQQQQAPSQQQQQQRAEREPVVRGVGIVKAVNSGDQLVVVQLQAAPVAGGAAPGPPPEWEVSLSNVRAPRLGVTGFGQRPCTPDQPFAWAAREFVRKMAIGRRVNFSVEHRFGDQMRGYGQVHVLPRPNAAPRDDGTPAQPEDVALAL
eukprot:CAMPEP_0198312620 /NCGR_PEP_ID=MMETSP1450-20131203/3931_1 /TAXON_ID=753684 ORGANISM="Madagascaria erythrocladiodes, Strain CCMP3234" /NCGR_SAMPLE_ID=MMETSP1450 /ASSEMBLY_ACC=CAM_ASM_001115 /LENGTH=157 /DNA_ID=CAMNT_0044015571 /DNA_START=42 /DNA_END=512 /DNA_ORIENTATION=+